MKGEWRRVGYAWYLDGGDKYLAEISVSDGGLTAQIIGTPEKLTSEFETVASLKRWCERHLRREKCETRN